MTAGIFAYEHQQKMKYLLCSTDRGRTVLVRNKTLIACVMTCAVWLIVYGFEIRNAVKIYGSLHSLSAPVQSFMSEFPYKMTVLSFLILIYLLRLLVLLSMTFMILLLSNLSNRANAAVITSLAVFSLPAAIVIMGGNIMEYFSVVKLLSPQENIPSLILSYTLCFIPGIIALIANTVIWKGIRYENNNSKRFI